MTSGAYNLSLIIQDTENVGWGNGLARMFPNHGAFGFYQAYYQNVYHFDASLTGVPYSNYLLPSVSQISPAAGSVAGGTIITITGSGFSKNISRNIVYVGGELCTVIASDFKSIQCTTSPIAPSSLATFKDNIVTGRDGTPGYL